MLKIEIKRKKLVLKFKITIQPHTLHQQFSFDVHICPQMFSHGVVKISVCRTLENYHDVTVYCQKGLHHCQKKIRSTFKKSLTHCGVKASLASGISSFVQLLCNLTDAFHFHAEHSNKPLHSSVCIFIQKAKHKWHNVSQNKMGFLNKLYSILTKKVQYACLICVIQVPRGYILNEYIFRSNL